MADLDERHAHDPEEIGRVGGQQVLVDHVQHHQDQRRGRAHHADVKAAIAEVLLVLDELELHRGREVHAVDVGDLAHAQHVHDDLKNGEHADRDYGGGIHGGRRWV